MKKSVKVAGIVLGIGLVFGIGSIAGANTDWETNAINSAYSDLLGTASQTVEKLTTDVDTDVENKIQSKLEGTVESEQDELQRLLDEYYQMKLDGLTDTPEFLALEEQISDIKNNVLESYKQQIDDAFEGK